MAALKVGEMAPDFELSGVFGERRRTFKLSDYRGKTNVILVFYVLDWSPVWALQMPAYQADLAKFAELNAQVVGISPDSNYSHIAWQKKEIGRLDYLLLSDFFPHGAIADMYGILRREGPPLAGISERAIFIVDMEGRIAFSKVYELGQQPPNEDLFEALRTMQSEKGATIG